ncbi:hypothetical protein [Novosphingobium sp. P6W]|uniref:hypothetical protein n=1 Tax=Novosphingobium sp. P6W TaxID=1609758 RepID=UPI0013B366B9|nr:hypothetical protein [Novosphingobium sp. P6W]
MTMIVYNLLMTPKIATRQPMIAAELQRQQNASSGAASGPGKSSMPAGVKPIKAVRSYLLPSPSMRALDVGNQREFAHLDQTQMPLLPLD